MGKQGQTHVHIWKWRTLIWLTLFMVPERASGTIFQPIMRPYTVWHTALFSAFFLPLCVHVRHMCALAMAVIAGACSWSSVSISVQPRAADQFSMTICDVTCYAPIRFSKYDFWSFAIILSASKRSICSKKRTAANAAHAPQTRTGAVCVWRIGQQACSWLAPATTLRVQA